MAVYLSPHNTPRVIVRVGLSTPVDIDCIIDTGFTGGIALPKSYQSSFSTQPGIFQQYQMADGSYTTFRLYTVKVTYEKRTKEITLFFINNAEALVGIEFLNGFRFLMDLQKQKIELR